MRRLLRQMLTANAYPGYVYGYPHKKAYRPLPPRPAVDAWRHESRDRLFCYVHVPFCTQRCSFCNLFTFVTAASPVDAYLDALARQMEGYAAFLRPATFARLYVGGGTPTFLTSVQLRRLVAHLRDTLSVEPERTGGCIEASPETVDEDKLGVLRELGFQRLSLGVQSFVAEELRHVNRRFEFEQNLRAVEMAGRAGFPQFNLDLIYGLPGQTLATWKRSLDTAAASAATSLFLYPLYVRPLTGLDRRADLPPSPTPLEMGRMYDAALERLTAAGFRQVTMRQFLRSGSSRLAGASGSEYSCQADAMLGLGAGARSYTEALHYSTPWKMLARNIRAVVEEFCAAADRPPLVTHGVELDLDERRRRFVILSLLYDGLDLDAFRARFDDDARLLFQEHWDALSAEECVRTEPDVIRLSPRGVRHADVVGQLFFSDRVRSLVDTFEYDT